MGLNTIDIIGEVLYGERFHASFYRGFSEE